ncbi:hypothetical protein GUJ93_ZPchr0004g38431 [Zizania palustris]|uniref:Uncharacterized protein n=1 Tax=Zizania palustris TaxID=103762 RepID=A0A8J5RZX6_ZIZPA|nr:hypothetical protein GUJ93_ZPchr0004g38431 [Zizania palustris]
MSTELSLKQDSSRITAPDFLPTRLAVGMELIDLRYIKQGSAGNNEDEVHCADDDLCGYFYRFKQLL